MDVEDFTREVKPHRKRSRLTQFEKEIHDLKKLGYSDMQIRDWLEENGIKVSRQNVQKYIARHLKDLETEQHTGHANSTPTAPSTDQAAQLAPEPSTPTDTRETKESPAARMQRLAREQRDEAAQKQFRHDKTGNNH